METAPGETVCVSQALLVTDKQSPLVSPETLERFRNSPLDGCFSVMAIAQRNAGYDPTIVKAPGRDAASIGADAGSFDKFVSELGQSPMFVLDFADTVQLKKQGRDFNVLVDEITGLFQGVATHDVTKIRQGLVSLAKAAISRTRHEQRHILFTQSVIQGYGDVIEVSIYSSSVLMVADQKKGATTVQTDYQVNRRHLKFRSDIFREYAELVWDQQDGFVQHYLTKNTTLADPKFTKRICLEPPNT